MKLPKILRKILGIEAGQSTRLGNPSHGDEGLKRAQTMYEMTGGKGFRVYPTEPRVDYQGKTRGERKRAARAAANAKEVDRQKDHASSLMVRGLSQAEANARFGSLS